MIFVTVGTHEQPFNRLIKKIDQLKKDNIFSDDVMIQTGFSDYKPMYCQSEKFLSHDQMIKNVSKARIIITHGGPSSFIMPLQVHKIPIVVPRLKKFGEHVNDHQLDFSKLVEKRKKNIIVVEDMDNLGDTIYNYDNEVKSLNGELNSNNKKFNRDFQNIVDDLFK